MFVSFSQSPFLVNSPLLVDVATLTVCFASFSAPGAVFALLPPDFPGILNLNQTNLHLFLEVFRTVSRKRANKRTRYDYYDATISFKLNN